ncbi:MAG: hypothetical protein LBR36_05555 [Bacteroidales bacterium]|jgi:hypothetical protein|nr:hypothetical protein [Bacteroidales bacterium]
MENPGEHLVGEYLKSVKKCDFVEYNLQTKEKQGEIDVIGINSIEKEIYVCEVAIHLETGLHYTKGNKPNNVDKLISKFEKDIKYTENTFPDYKHHFMLWTPIVRIPKKENVHNQLNDIEDVKKRIEAKKKGVSIELIYNEKFLQCIDELREKARATTQAMSSPIMRFLQIEEKLKEKTNAK